MQTKKSILTATSAMLFLALNMIAQPALQPTPTQTPPAGAGGNVSGGERGKLNVQAQIKATDEEWRVINPRLQAVITARQAVMTYTASAGGRGGFGGPGPNFGTDSFEGPGNAWAAAAVVAWRLEGFPRGFGGPAVQGREAGGPNAWSARRRGGRWAGPPEGGRRWRRRQCCQYRFGGTDNSTR